MSVPRALAWAAAVAAGACWLLTAVAGPAAAHGTVPDASNFASRATGSARLVDGQPADAAAAPEGVTWEVQGADAFLVLTNTGARDVVVSGYNGEPYLRVGPEGTFENRLSPATYLNADRYAQTTVPEVADATATPQWRKVSDGASWRWHDHRIHWMAQESPPAVDENAGRAQTVLEWYVPYRSGDSELALQGVLEYVPPGPLWPWLVGAALALTLPVVVLAARAGAGGARRAAVVAICVVAVAGLVVTVGDVAATPDGGGADVWAVVQALVPASVAVALAWSQWRAPDEGAAGSGSALLIAAVVLAISGGIVRLPELRSSQIVNLVPGWSVRAITAAALTAVLPALLLVVSRDRVAADDTV